MLPAGRVLSLADPPLAANETKEPREVEQIVIIGGKIVSGDPGKSTPLVELAALVAAAGQPPALSNAKPMVTATGETWTASSSAETFTSATAAHQFVRYHSGIALASTDAAAPVNLAGV